ncbi:hypothetical protein PCANC_08424 [Puccinia coronata f. sp. avenae]|uniref:Ribonuclease P/MRP protein subunit POP5 n=1 Tax=Puccinia coronata f. sp. avenae TaxID=200324 RepID=A0A2N5T5T2_9BASI|nr:hypothetical protein PCASD_25593 [Puccinia coronata f. sp. avenae]PLW20834.1 hypothetical protein PCANC_08242 [Puccinia coronata f. sp. avenae]PLW30079.1 hypothetical protein PCASD_17417 [Puccinia coronata f. sp. avenae]PLW51967.1 hypothetical protein PCANC_08424 [Puccinia coronata f. sp. avenae]
MVRFKNRYLLIQLIYGPRENIAANAPANLRLNEKHLIDLIRSSIQLNFGSLGAGEAGADLNIKYYSPTTSNVILRCKRDQVSKVRASLLFITQINPQIPVIFNVIHVSGTIRKTQSFLIDWDRQQMLGSHHINPPSEQSLKTHFDQIAELEP